MHKFILICLIFNAYSLFGQDKYQFSLRTRIWSNKGIDEGSIHPIGNGEMLIYGQGPNFHRVFGAPYSAPNYMQLTLEENDRTLRVESKREKNTAIWHHNFYNEGRLIAQMADYVLPDRNIFFRDIDATENLKFKVTVPPEVNAFSTPNYFKYVKNENVGSYILRSPSGSTFFVQNPIPQELCMIIGGSGAIDFSEMTGRDFFISIKPGKSRLILCNSKIYPENVASMELALKNPDTDFMAQSRKYWHDFSARRKDFASKIPSSNALKDSILDAIDGVSILIKAQQSSSGGVMAGHIYNMAYVRDMSGVLRGLLALGYIPEAKAILDFWIHKYTLFGKVLCADGMDNDAARLLLTNDEVEVPAYIVQDCFLYFEATKDNEFLKKAFPMMQWAFEVQLPHLVEGMTEFSGDETYIAGGTYPGQLLYHGSAESTLLFITGGEKLCDWAAKEGLWKGEKLESYCQKVALAKSKYKSNFMEGGIFYANNPNREKVAGTPRFRFGFCAIHDRDQKTPLITWTERDEYGRYICPDCRNKFVPERDSIDHNKRYILNSVSLVPGLLGSDLFSPAEVAQIIKPGVEIFRAKGSVPSNIEGIRSLGYDYGLLLYNLVKLNDPLKEKLVRKTLRLLDPTGAWVEYYDNDKPYNCRTRPWESAMNIEAIIEYLK
jgi:hypothetical protein